MNKKDKMFKPSQTDQKKSIGQVRMKDAVYKAIYRATKMDPYLLGGQIGAFTTVIYLIADYLLSLVLGSNPVPYYSAKLIMPSPSPAGILSSVSWPI